MNLSKEADRDVNPLQDLVEGTIALILLRNKRECLMAVDLALESLLPGDDVIEFLNRLKIAFHRVLEWNLAFVDSSLDVSKFLN